MGNFKCEFCGETRFCVQPETINRGGFVSICRACAEIVLASFGDMGRKKGDPIRTPEGDRPYGVSRRTGAPRSASRRNRLHDERDRRLRD